MKKLTENDKPDCYPPSVYVVGNMITEVYAVKPESSIEPHDFWLTTYDCSNLKNRHHTCTARYPSDIELVFNAMLFDDSESQSILDKINSGKPLFFMRSASSPPSTLFLEGLLQIEKLQK